MSYVQGQGLMPKIVFLNHCYPASRSKVGIKVKVKGQGQGHMLRSKVKINFLSKVFVCI